MPLPSRTLIVHLFLPYGLFEASTDCDVTPIEVVVEDEREWENGQSEVDKNTAEPAEDGSIINSLENSSLDSEKPAKFSVLSDLQAKALGAKTAGQTASIPSPKKKHLPNPFVKPEDQTQMASSHQELKQMSQSYVQHDTLQRPALSSAFSQKSFNGSRWQTAPKPVPKPASNSQNADSAMAPEHVLYPESISPIDTRSPINLDPKPPSKSKSTAADSNVSRSPDFMGSSPFQSALKRRMSRPRSSSRTSTLMDYCSKVFNIEASAHANSSLINAVMSAKEVSETTLFIGHTGANTSTLDLADRAEYELEYLVKYQCVPVWTESNTFDVAYLKFCKHILWPILHSHIREKFMIEEALRGFQEFVSLNQSFCDQVVRTYRPGDLICIHDYRESTFEYCRSAGTEANPADLCLVPAMIRKQLPDANISFFLHAAFCTNEIFRTLACRERILEGMLGSDSLIFQAANYARHFKSTVARLMHYEVNPNGVRVSPDNFVTIVTCPIGINAPAFAAESTQPAVKLWEEMLRDKYAKDGVKLVASRDKLDGIKGLQKKMHSIDYLLQNNAEWRGRVVLVQALVPTPDAEKVLRDLVELVHKINSKWSTLNYEPIVLITQDLTRDQYCGLLKAADAFLVTSLREGMNLSSHEYIVAQQDSHGPLICSEFCGTYTHNDFRQSYGCNPWDYADVSRAIIKSLLSGDEEKLSRWNALYSQVIKQDASKWITNIINVSQKASAQNGRLQRKLSTPGLDVSNLQKSSHRSQAQLILLDLEGEFWDSYKVQPTEDHLTLPSRIRDSLALLCKNSQNLVYVMSGMSRQQLSHLIGETLSESCGLISENGFAVKCPGHPWNCLHNENMSWKSPCLDVIKFFTLRTPQSYVQDRNSSLCQFGWRYQPNSWSKMKAIEAQNHIFNSMGEKYNLSIIPGENSFLILPSGVSRRNAVNHLLEKHAGALDVVFAISRDSEVLSLLHDQGYLQVVTASSSALSGAQSYISGMEQIATALSILA